MKCSALAPHLPSISEETHALLTYQSSCIQLTWLPTIPDDLALRESIPRQVDKKSGGPQGERGLEFSRMRKGKTTPPTFFRIA